MTTKPKFKIGDRVKALGVLSGKTGNIYLIKLSPAGYFSYCIDSYPEYYIDEYILELVEEKPDPQTKIDMVVKCIDNTGWPERLTINKFYVAKYRGDGIRIVSDRGIENYPVYRERFKIFKVGDRYKHSLKGDGYTVAIKGFWIKPNGDIKLRYLWDKEQSQLIEIDIEKFDKVYTKIEDEPEPKFDIGDKVLINAYPSVRHNGIIKRFYLGKSEYYYDVENVGYVGCIPESCLTLMEPKKEWTPKYKTGDAVTLKYSPGYFIVENINLINKDYTLLYPNGKKCYHYWNEQEIDGLFQPMQELKNTIESQKQTIADLEDKLAREKSRVNSLMNIIDEYKLKSKSKWWKM